MNKLMAISILILLVCPYVVSADVCGMWPCYSDDDDHCDDHHCDDHDDRHDHYDHQDNHHDNHH